MTKTSIQTRYSMLSKMLAALAITVGFFLCQGAVPASAQTIVDEWATVQAPKPPELKPVTLDPKTTALLVLDFVKQTCNTEATTLSEFSPSCSSFVETCQRQRNNGRP